MHTLRVQQLSFAYDKKEVLKDIELQIPFGKISVILGANGCGKSTLLNIMGLLDTPTGGSIEVAGTRIESMKDKELAAFRNKKL